MSTAEAVTLRILDKDYTIACPADERLRLIEASRYLDDKLRGIRSSGKVIGAERIAVMAALNIAHELLHSRQQLDHQQADSSRLSALLQRIDQVLAADLAEP